MTDRSDGPDPWRPLVGEPTEEDFENAYDGDAELDATIRARRRRRRIAVITAGGALTFAIGGSLVLPEGDADAPVDSPAATLASADRQPSDDDGAADGDPADQDPDGGAGAPLPIATTIDLPPALADTAEPFEIVAVTPSELHRISVPSGEVTTRSLVDDERFRTGSSFVAATPTMSALRVADDSVTLVPNSDAPLIDWPADTFGAPASNRSVVVEGVAPGAEDRFVISAVTTFDSDPGDDGIIDETEVVPPVSERYVVDAGLAAPIDRLLPGVPIDAALIGRTGWWWTEDLAAGTLTLGGPSAEPDQIEGRVVGTGSTSLVAQTCTPDCALLVYEFDGSDVSDLRTLDGDAVPDAFVESVSVFRGAPGIVSDDATVMLGFLGGIDLTDGSSIEASGFVWRDAWVPGATDIVTLDRDQAGLALLDLDTGEATAFGAELGRPVAIATVPLS